jgi:hypothetical protein
MKEDEHMPLKEWQEEIDYILVYGKTKKEIEKVKQKRN